jgi:hypothetical protein
MDWIIANKEWLFSGLLVGFPIALLGWIFAKRRSAIFQKQKAGNDSFNIQIGGDIKVTKGRDDSEPVSKGR